MSAVETQTASESRSSVSISMNSKGEAQVGVKVYVGEDEAALETARQVAIKVYNSTASAVRR